MLKSKLSTLALAIALTALGCLLSRASSLRPNKL